MPLRTDMATRRAQQEAVERRIVRLALLLLANEVEAVNLIGPVLRLRQHGTDLAERNLANIDRLVVVRAREVRASSAHQALAVFPGPAGALLQVLHVLPGQAMEAWTFAHVERQEVRRVSRAMDCSTTAIARHLELAQGQVRERFRGDLESAAQQLRRAYEAFDAAPAITAVRARARTRSRNRRWLVVSSAALVVLLVALIVGLLR